MWSGSEPGQRPPAIAGAAMLELIKQEQFPSFALVAYEDLLDVGRGQDPPKLLALIAEDAILLAPVQVAGGWSGFLITEATAERQIRAFHWPSQQDRVIWLQVPEPVAGTGGAVWATEAAFLAIHESPDTHYSP